MAGLPAGYRTPLLHRALWVWGPTSASAKRKPPWRPWTNRSGLQVAMAEGSATQRSISVVVGLFGGYANSDANKIVAAGFLDACNKMVSAVQSNGYSYGP